MVHRRMHGLTEPWLHNLATDSLVAFVRDTDRFSVPSAHAHQFLYDLHSILSLKCAQNVAARFCIARSHANRGYLCHRSKFSRAKFVDRFHRQSASERKRAAV